MSGAGRTAARRDYHAEQPTSLRLSHAVKEKLARIAERNGTSVHAEILAAVARHVEEHA